MTTSIKLGVDEPSPPCSRVAEHVEPQIGRGVAVAAAAKPTASWWASKWTKVSVVAAIALIMLMAAAIITVGVLCFQVSGEKSIHPWNNTITTNVYVEGDDTIDTSEMVKRPKSEQDDSLTIEEFRALLAHQDSLTKSIDMIVGVSGDTETRLKQLEAELEASAEALFAKLRAMDANNSNHVQLDGPDPTNVTFPTQEVFDSESETSEGTNSGTLRKLSTTSGPSADAPALGIKATPEFQKVVAAARAGDHRALNVFNFPCKARFAQSCRRVPYVSCSWRGCKWKSYNVCVPKPAGLKCETFARFGEAGQCSAERAFPIARQSSGSRSFNSFCKVKLTTMLKFHGHGTDVRVGFVIYPGQAHASSAFLEIRVKYEMRFSAEAHCEGQVEAKYEYKKQIPVAYGIFLEAAAGIKMQFKAGIKGTVTHTLPGAFSHKLNQWPAHHAGAATTKFTGGPSIQMNIEASLAVKAFAPEIAELVYSFGFRAGSDTGFKLCGGVGGGLAHGYGGTNWKSEFFMTIAGKAPASNLPKWSFSCSEEKAFKVNALEDLLKGMGNKIERTYYHHNWGQCVGYTPQHCHMD